MSGSSGGRADKLGNRYEGLRITYQLLRLLAEDIAAVQVVAIGKDDDVAKWPRYWGRPQKNGSIGHIFGRPHHPPEPTALENATNLLMRGYSRFNDVIAEQQRQLPAFGYLILRNFSW
jgi:hypothetical protein